jgi:hypothetical protein
VNITFKDTSAYFTDPDKKVLSRKTDFEATLKRLTAELAVVKSAIASNENPDPDPEARLEQLIAGETVSPPKSWEDQYRELQYAIRDTNEALDALALKEKQIRLVAGQKLANDIKPQADALEKQLIDALVVARGFHLEYFRAKRYLINNGIGTFGNFGSSVDEVLGLPTDGTPLSDLFSDAVKKGLLLSQPKGFNNG